MSWISVANNKPVILFYRDVCLAAFLYLEHTTLHQLKMVRKHIRDHGCTPKEHGNHRKRPHNVFSLDIYQTATKFLQVLTYKTPLSFEEMRYPQ